VIKGIVFVIVSWVLMHIFSVVGIFISFFYLVWWFIFPKSIPCLSCRTKAEGKYCSLCKNNVSKATGRHPKSFYSVIVNTLLLIVISIISIGLVYLESRVLLKLGIPSTPKTASFVIPAKGQHLVGEIFPMKIEITGIETPINAVQVDIGFDPLVLEVVDISTEGSFATIFIQQEINNEYGYVRLSGGLPNPGFDQNKGFFGTIYFQAKIPGPVNIEFLPTSLILANDGRGSDIIKELVSASYLILAEDFPPERIEAQKAILRADVLGKKSDQTQLIFFDEQKVLGEKVNKEIQKSKPSIFQAFGKSVLEQLLKFDIFILSIL